MVNEIASEIKGNKTGVPQGGLSGHLLFKLQVNDLANLFADVEVLTLSDDTSSFCQ